MSEPTKACNLTEAEIETLIIIHGDNISEDMDYKIDRIKYLNSRLKTFKEPVTEVLSTSGAAGWGTN